LCFAWCFNELTSKPDVHPKIYTSPCRSLSPPKVEGKLFYNIFDEKLNRRFARKLSRDKLRARSVNAEANPARTIRVCGNLTRLFYHLLIYR
jgi:hypothetical protein